MDWNLTDLYSNEIVYVTLDNCKLAHDSIQKGAEINAVLLAFLIGFCSFLLMYIYFNGKTLNTKKT